MERRDFLVGAGAIVSAGVISTNPRIGDFVGSALAAGVEDGRKANLEQKLADFALSIKYGDLPAEVIASAKRVLLDTLACAFGAVGSEAAGIAEKTIRSTFGDGNAASIIGYSRTATIEGADSDRSRPLIPTQSGHRFRWKSATDSDRSRPPC